MTTLFRLHDRLFDGIERHLAGWAIPTLARLVFAGTLLIYYWNAARGKLGDGVTGLFLPSDNAYFSVLPKRIEAIGFDFSQLGALDWLIVFIGTWAEFILPALIVLGLFTRLAAIAMIGFVIVQSWVDVTGHGAEAGQWFDAPSNGLIADQRAYWVFLLVVLVLRGGGPFSLDRLIGLGQRREA